MSGEDLARSAPRFTGLLLCLVFIIGPLLPQSVHPATGAVVEASIAIALALQLYLRGAALWKPLFKHPLGPPLLLWVLLSAASLLWSPYYDRTESAFFLRLEYLALFVLMAGTINRVWRRNILCAIALTAIAVAVIAAVDHLSGYEDELAYLRSGDVGAMLPEFRERMIHSLEQHRALALYGNPNHLASHMAMVLPGFLAIVIWGRRWPLRSACLVAAVLLGMIIAFTQSRGGILMLLVSGCFLLLLLLRSLRPSRTVTPVLLFLGLALTCGCTSHMMQTTTLSTRGQYADGAMRLIKQYPLLGSGADIFSVRYSQVRAPHGDETQYPHNYVLQAGVEMGVPGVIAAFWLYVAAALVGWRFLRDSRVNGVDPIRAGLLCGVFGYLVHALVDINNTIPQLNHLFIAGAALAINTGQTARSEALTPKRSWMRSAGVLVIVAAFIYGGMLPYLARTRFETGKVLEGEGRYAEALQSYSSAVQMNPDNAEYVYRLGMERLRLSPELGIATIKRAISLNPEQAFLHDVLAGLLMKQGNKKEALEESDKAIALHPARESYRERRKMILAQ